MTLHAGAYIGRVGVGWGCGWGLGWSWVWGGVEVWLRWPNSQIPECTCPISHNVPFGTEMRTFLFWMEHCGIWNKWIPGFVKLFYYVILPVKTQSGNYSSQMRDQRSCLLTTAVTPRFNTLRPRQDGRYFADDGLKCIFLNEDVWISLKIPLKFVARGPINNIPAFGQIMVWRRPGDRPLSEPMMVCLLTHICVTRPQWVN